MKLRVGLLHTGLIKQMGQVNVFVWDAPGHAQSWPFKFTFNLMDKARWLDDILNKENFNKRVIVGQSMGGYVGQAYSQLFSEKLKGFVSIDSAPLQRKYVTAIEIWLLKRMEPVYRHYPWKSLLKSGRSSAFRRSLTTKLLTLIFPNSGMRYIIVSCLKDLKLAKTTRNRKYSQMYMQAYPFSSLLAGIK